MARLTREDVETVTDVMLGMVETLNLPSTIHDKAAEVANAMFNAIDDQEPPRSFTMTDYRELGIGDDNELPTRTSQ
jgi:hypothetical protein